MPTIELHEPSLGCESVFGAIRLLGVSGLVSLSAAAPGATLTSGFPVRVSEQAGGALRLNTGIEAFCPRAGTVCRGRVRVSSPAGLTYGVRALRLRPDTKVRIALALNRRGVAALRPGRTVKLRISAGLTGPNRQAVGVVRMTTVRR